MHKFMGKAGIALIVWMAGVGGLWADQAPQDAWLQSIEAVEGQVTTNESISNPANAGDPMLTQNTVQPSQSTTKKKAKKQRSKSTKKSKAKKPKKAKSKKTKKKSKSKA